MSEHDSTLPVPASEVPARLVPVPAGDLELRIYNGGMRWRLTASATVEVWIGPHLVGSLSGASLSRIVQHHLATAALQAAVQREMDAPAATWPELPVPERPLLPAPAPAHVPIPPAKRAELREQRRRRRKDP
jgi:hypothetical protein